MRHKQARDRMVNDYGPYSMESYHYVTPTSLFVLLVFAIVVAGMQP